MKVCFFVALVYLRVIVLQEVKSYLIKCGSFNSSDVEKLD